MTNFTALFTAVTFILLALTQFGWIAVSGIVLGLFELITGIIWAIDYARPVIVRPR